MPVFDVDSWASSLKTKYNIPDDDLPVKEIKGGFLRQDTFTKRQQELDRLHAERMAEEDRFHGEIMTAKEKLQLVNSLEAKFGPAEQWSDALTATIASAHPQLAQADPGQSFSMDQVNEMVTQAVNGVRTELGNQIRGIGTGAAVMIDFMSDAPNRWKEKYGKNFPKKEFTDFFQKSGTNDPYLAYELFEKPHAETWLTEKHNADLEKAKQEGYQSAMSKYGHVEAPTTQRTGMFFNQGPKPVLDPATGQPAAAQPTEPSHEARRAAVGKAFVQALDAAEGGKVPGATPGQ